MGFLSSLDISGSALTAQRLRMDVISNNIANMNTVGYKRKVTVLGESQGESFGAILGENMGGGVEVSAIVEDTSNIILEYDPTNPLADANGYVAHSNVDSVTELTDMMSATRSYEANVTALDATKSMAAKALEIGK